MEKTSEPGRPPAPSGPKASADLLTAVELGKSYGPRPALRRVSFVMPPGSLTLVLGPNGSGKSTLLRILAGLCPADAGLIQRRAALEDMGFLTHESCAYPGLTALENLAFWTGLHGLEPSRAELENLLAEAGLAGFAHTPAAAFSQGMLQRLNIARCFASRPRLLFLDEPGTSLDHAGLALLKRYLAATISEGGAAVLAGHQIHDFLPEADFALVLTSAAIDAAPEQDASSIVYYGPAAAFAGCPETGEGRV